jgi:hypothetical protein
MEMLPVPVPEVGTTVIQRLVVIAFQAQVEFEVVTVVENVPPPTESVWLVGEIEYVQPVVPAAWAILNVRPATVRVARRVLVVKFGAVVNEAVPVPVPEGVVTVTQLALLTTVHTHEASDAVMVVDTGPPSAVTVRLAGEIE